MHKQKFLFTTEENRSKMVGIVDAGMGGRPDLEKHGVSVGGTAGGYFTGKTSARILKQIVKKPLRRPIKYVRERMHRDEKQAAANHISR